MTIVIPIRAILGGIVSALLFGIVARGYIIGFTAPFLPLFPLALAGMAYGRAGITTAGITCALGLFVTLDADNALLIIATQIVPMLLFIRQLMVAIIAPSQGKIIWSPVCYALSIVAIYGAICYATLIAGGSELYTHVQDVLKQEITRQSATMDAEAVTLMNSMLSSLPHLLLAMEYWAWSVVMYFIVVLAHYVVATFRTPRRPHVRLAGHTPPNYVLGLLAAAFLVAVLAPAQISAAAQAAFIIMLLPYLFAGMSHAHRKITALKQSGFWLLTFYASFIIFSPMVLAITIYGVTVHVRRVVALGQLSK